MRSDAVGSNQTWSDVVKGGQTWSEAVYCGQTRQDAVVRGRAHRPIRFHMVHARLIQFTTVFIAVWCVGKHHHIDTPQFLVEKIYVVGRSPAGAWPGSGGSTGCPPACPAPGAAEPGPCPWASKGGGGCIPTTGGIGVALRHSEAADSFISTLHANWNPLPE